MTKTTLHTSLQGNYSNVYSAHIQIYKYPSNAYVAHTNTAHLSRATRTVHAMAHKIRALPATSPKALPS